MNDELSDSNRSLDKRFADLPHVRQRLHHIADMMDKALAEGCSADEAEALAIEQVRQLGGELLQDWAQQKAQLSQTQAQVQHPGAIKHIKKKVAWHTTFGTVEVIEQLLRLGRRGPELRPFCEAAGVRHRGYSLRLQRAMTDFGAESSFARASSQLEEHYGISVPVEAVRRHTLKHGRAMNPLPPAAKKAATRIITQMDGSMIPVMTPGTGADGRKGRQLFWREVRLCSARVDQQVQALYAASLGSAETAGWMWRETVQAAGLGPDTYVHGGGDGAPWIVDQFQENFGDQGKYLVDFYHVSQYLGAAAQAIKPSNPQEWRRRQQGRLLENKLKPVLRALRRYECNEAEQECPVEAALNYLEERSEYLDYAGARKQGLPIGSGEIESAHRHVIQQRLKLAGCWWKETNAQIMLNLRVARANQLWNHYWQNN